MWNILYYKRKLLSNLQFSYFSHNQNNIFYIPALVKKQSSDSSEDSNMSQDANRNRAQNPNQSLKERINSLVLKTLQENTGRENRQNMLNNQNTLLHSDSWKSKVFQNTRVICSEKDCQMVVNDIMRKNQQSAKKNMGHEDEEEWPFTEDKIVVGFDCEGINLGLKGQLTLIQIATMTGFSYVFDLISCPGMIEGGLKRLLESPNVVKVSHEPNMRFYRSLNYFPL